MNPLRSALLVALSCLTPLAFGFSRQGHESIALLAYANPKLSPVARAAITEILGTETIAFAAEWPDAIKPPFGALASSAEAKAFNHDHGQNRSWHFVNFPIGSTSYSEKSPYAKSTDLAHAVKGCIAVLEGTGSFDHLTQREALRYLVHLVGDAHQPLHTSFELWDVTNPQHPKMLPASPTTPAGAMFDGGGNDLYYTDKEELHAAWDDDLVADIVPSGRTDKLVSALQSEISATKGKGRGNYRNWVDQWLGDSMKLVPGAFTGLSYNRYVEEKNADGKVTRRKILVALPSNYSALHAKEERAQIVKGASHLLQLFNAIQWKPKGP